MRSYLFVSVGLLCLAVFVFFFFFQAEDGIRDSLCDWSSDVCSSDLSTTCSRTRRLTTWPSNPTLGEGPSRRSRNAARIWPRGCCTSLLQLPSRHKPTTIAASLRSEERRVGKEGRSALSSEHAKREDE